MAWDSKYVKYALAKPDGKTVKVFKDQYNYLPISVGESVNYAIWAGDELNVYLTNGRVRRYKDQYNYKWV